MCTAISIYGASKLFGRTLDLDLSYWESVVITPRNFRLRLLYEKEFDKHLSILGVAAIQNDFPLYYDAVNEAGLAMAGLNFPKNAVYLKQKKSMYNVASFELVLWVLGQCKNVREAAELLKNTNITPDSFSDDLVSTPLHWMIADRERSIVAEPTSGGITIYENDIGVLTNAPAFSYHITHLSDFMNISSSTPSNNICPSTELDVYSRGMGAIGLPGDFSSASRFVRAVFAKEHTSAALSKREEISRFFHIMDTVSVPCGCIRIDEGKSVRTLYTSCIDMDTLTYHFTTYGCRRIRAVRLDDKRAEQNRLAVFQMDIGEDVFELCEN
ncbi:MAG: choloylglycine hydrolase [Clostridia bacterium]|nr:choloylglycine hydrolase [Clostridia bacterium]